MTVIMIQGLTPSAILTTLQSTLQTIENWCKEHRLEISKDKLALMPMFIRNRKVYKRHPTIVAWGINVVSKMWYLGIILDCKLDWYPHTQYLENKLLRIRNSLVRCSKATWGTSFHNLLTVYKYALLPAITYASEAWEYHDIQKSKKQTATNSEIFPYIHNKGLQNSLAQGCLSNYRDNASRSSYAFI